MKLIVASVHADVESETFIFTLEFPRMIPGEIYDIYLCHL